MTHEDKTFNHQEFARVLHETIGNTEIHEIAIRDILFKRFGIFAKASQSRIIVSLVTNRILEKDGLLYFISERGLEIVGAKKPEVSK